MSKRTKSRKTNFILYSPLTAELRRETVYIVAEIKVWEFFDEHEPDEHKPIIVVHRKMHSDGISKEYNYANLNDFFVNWNILGRRVLVEKKGCHL
jgi:hypothetical protein